jgi:hypothetical protein
MFGIPANQEANQSSSAGGDLGEHEADGTSLERDGEFCDAEFWRSLCVPRSIPRQV